MSERDVAHLLDLLEHVADRLPVQLDDTYSLDELDRAARATTQLERWLLAEVGRRERALDKEAALARARAIAAARDA